MKKIFNLSAYKQLLKLEKNGKISVVDEKFRELCGYAESVKMQIMFNLKVDYLIEKYLNRVVTPPRLSVKIFRDGKTGFKNSRYNFARFSRIRKFYAGGKYL